MSLFGLDDRDRVRDRVLELASSDERVVAGAVVGSLANSDGDRWSDLDLTFAVAAGVPVPEVLSDWTRTLVDELDAVHLFDLPSGPSIYRVFLLPGCLQLDLSFTPAAEFGAREPDVQAALRRRRREAARARTGRRGSVRLRRAPCAARPVLHRARSLLAGEYWISAVRDYALSLACRARDLPAREGRGFDDLPAEVLNGFADTFVSAPERDELLRALACAVAGLLRQADAVEELAAKVEPDLRLLTSAWS